MKTLTKLALVAAILASCAAAQAEWVRGHFRSNGTYVSPYYRTRANSTVDDNLSYRGYAPRYSTSYFTYSGYGYTPRCSSYSSPASIYGSSTQLGDFTFHNYYSSHGGGISGTTTRIGNSSFTSLYGW
jgi:hypothetical protein